MSLSLYVAAGMSPKPLHEFLAEPCWNGESPLFHWLEPRPFLPRDEDGKPLPGPLKDFFPFGVGVPRTDLELDEARLFWADGALHAVADEEGGCRWFRYAETAFEGAEPIPNVRREIAPVLPWRDRGRFRLPMESCRESLRALLYSKGGRLLAWRIVASS